MQRPGASDEDTDTSTIDEPVGGLVKPGCSRVHFADWESFERESSALACLAHDYREL